MPFEDVSPGRRRIMSAIRARDTKPELVVRRALHAEGYRYRVHVGKLPGRPDIVFTKRRVVVFVHGCFWHAHQGCKNFQLPKTRLEYWSEKLAGNAARDAFNVKRLEEEGWAVVVVWECEPPEIWKPRLQSVLGPLHLES